MNGVTVQSIAVATIFLVVVAVGGFWAIRVLKPRFDGLRSFSAHSNDRHALLVADLQDIAESYTTDTGAPRVPVNAAASHTSGRTSRTKKAQWVPLDGETTETTDVAGSGNPTDNMFGFAAAPSTEPLSAEHSDAGATVHDEDVMALVDALTSLAEDIRRIHDTGGRDRRQQAAAVAMSGIQSLPLTPILSPTERG